MTIIHSLACWDSQRSCVWISWLQVWTLTLAKRLPTIRDLKITSDYRWLISRTFLSFLRTVPTLKFELHLDSYCRSVFMFNLLMFRTPLWKVRKFAVDSGGELIRRQRPAACYQLRTTEIRLNVFKQHQRDFFIKQSWINAALFKNNWRGNHTELLPYNHENLIISHPI